VAGGEIGPHGRQRRQQPGRRRPGLHHIHTGIFLQTQIIIPGTILPSHFAQSSHALMPTDAEPRVTPPKFNYNLTIKNTTAEKFSCFPTAEEERTDEFLKVSKNQDQTNTEETASENFQSICSITKNKNNPFAAWRPFIPNPQEPVYQSSPAQPWWQVSSAPPFLN